MKNTFLNRLALAYKWNWRRNSVLFDFIEGMGGSFKMIWEGIVGLAGIFIVPIYSVYLLFIRYIYSPLKFAFLGKNKFEECCKIVEDFN